MEMPGLSIAKGVDFKFQTTVPGDYMKRHAAEEFMPEKPTSKIVGRQDASVSHLQNLKKAFNGKLRPSPFR